MRAHFARKTKKRSVGFGAASLGGTCSSKCWQAGKNQPRRSRGAVKRAASKTSFISSTTAHEAASSPSFSPSARRGGFGKINCDLDVHRKKEKSISYQKHKIRGGRTASDVFDIYEIGFFGPQHQFRVGSNRSFSTGSFPPESVFF